MSLDPPSSLKKLCFTPKCYLMFTVLAGVIGGDWCPNWDQPLPSGQPSGQSDVQNPAQVGSEHICIRRGLGMILKKVHVPHTRCDLHFSSKSWMEVSPGVIQCLKDHLIGGLRRVFKCPKSSKNGPAIHHHNILYISIKTYGDLKIPNIVLMVGDDPQYIC